jgi:Ca2+-transporting ATPase
LDFIGLGDAYLVLGDVHEAVVLGASILGVIAIAVIQERKAERALEALRDLSSPRALVIRGGERRRIAGRDVVRGDLLILSEGDRVPADARLVLAVAALAGIGGVAWYEGYKAFRRARPARRAPER